MDPGGAPFSRPATDAADAGFAEHRLLGGEEPVRLEDLLVGHRRDGRRLAGGGGGRVPRRRVADADRRGDRVGLLHPMALDDGRRAGRLEPEHPRQPRAAAGVLVLRYPFQYAVMFPRVATGMQCMSGASPSTSTISKAPVFCPSMRNGFTELTTVTGAWSPRRRTMASASSKLPRICDTRAPCTSACASLPSAMWPSGMSTAPVSPARAA